MLKMLFQGLARRSVQRRRSKDPFDHPAIRRMSVAERADLPRHLWREGA